MPVNILMPALSPTMTEGNLAKWLKSEGDPVEAGEIIAEIETDKATMEVEAVDEGVLGKIVVPEGSEGVAVNAVIGVLLAEGEDAGAIEDAPAPAETPEPRAEPAPEAPPKISESVAERAPARPVPGERVAASPLARRMATQAGLELSAIRGSGPKGRIVKADIEAVLAGGAAAPAAAPTGVPARAPAVAASAEDRTVRLSTMRRVIADRMTESKATVPHFYLTVDCEVDELLKVRREINDRIEGARVSVNDIVIRACALALREVPAANVSWAGEGTMKQHGSVDISVAVAVPGGLVTPIVRNADAKGLVGIAAEMKELAARAKEGKLLPDEYQGGSFSISNLGMYGVRSFDAVINPPQACILAVGAAEPRPVVRDGEIVPATVMSCTLSVDHRVVDGAIGAELLGAIKRNIEYPPAMLA
ncbi:MAG: pyruvate dehydrogenase complex dihydrolipoamide acetyltransferase [Defluviicoccus sp.]|nr:pyruvate dehydrogenase complex dihydrolipoamide acetyltransferase [Defluviicoccus sp.]MDE0279327.1 pyruvate dehydrogenase complex dihydrolipoamide acetyltransferase [Defluviicoccus sp.]